MEFDFPVAKCLKLDEEGICIYEAPKHKPRVYSEAEQNLKTLINVMGERSAKAQGLKQIITSYEKLQTESGQRLYVVAEGGRACQGILKIGRKNLFHRDHVGSIKEIQPICVLDFYVHESCQRKGLGKILFETMLRNENVQPEQLGYDRPSPKLMGFLKKHYNLAKHVAQNNNYVVFDAYFKARNSSMNASNRPMSSIGNRDINNSNNRPALQNNVNNINTVSSSSKSSSIVQANNRRTESIPSMSQMATKYFDEVSQKAKTAAAATTKSTGSQNDCNDESTSRRSADQPVTQIPQINQSINSADPLYDLLSNSDMMKPSSNSIRGTQPWADTGINFYQTSSQNYGGHYKTFYKR